MTEQEMQARITDLEQQLADANRFLANDSLSKRNDELEATVKLLQQVIQDAADELGCPPDNEEMLCAAERLKADAARYAFIYKRAISLLSGFSGWRVTRDDYAEFESETLCDAIDAAIKESEAK